MPLGTDCRVSSFFPPLVFTAGSCPLVSGSCDFLSVDPFLISLPSHSLKTVPESSGIPGSINEQNRHSWTRGPCRLRQTAVTKAAAPPAHPSGSLPSGAWIRGVEGSYVRNETT